MTDDVAGGSSSSSSHPAEPRRPDDWRTADGRWIGLGSKRIRKVRAGLERRRDRLVRSIANVRNAGREPRPADLERWAIMAADVSSFEAALASLLAGEAAPLSPLTGARSGLLPDRIGGKADDDAKS